MLGRVKTAVLKSVALLGVMTIPAFAAEPNFSMSLSPTAIGPGNTSTLIYTIDNTANGVGVSDMAFDTMLPAAVTLEDPANPMTDCVDATLVAANGGSMIDFSEGRIAPGEICTVSVDVTSGTAGVHMISSDGLSSSEGSGSSTSVDLTVDTVRPGFTKSFFPDNIARNSVSTLTFTIDNSANPGALSTITFTDPLPAGMVVADPANASSTCGSASIVPEVTADPGTSSISMSVFGINFPGFEVLLAGATCTVTVNVVGTQAGTLTNVTDP